MCAAIWTAIRNQCARGFMDGETLSLGTHTLRFLETPHVHHWDSMMMVEESTRSLFPSDLFLQPGDQPPVVTENLADPMCEVYRQVGIFAHEAPVRQAVDRIQQFPIDWVHAMHGGTLTGAALPPYITALQRQEYAYRGKVLGRQIRPEAATGFPAATVDAPIAGR